MSGATGSGRIDTSIKIGYTLPRFRYVIWALTALAIICIAFFGTKNAGSYAGYDAGSLFEPESYVDTWYTETFGDASGMTDDELNDYLGGMRNKNLPGVIFGGVILVASLGVAYLAGEGWVRNVGLSAATLEHSKPSFDFFSAAYANDKAYQAADHIEKGSSLSLGQYAVLAMCLPAADSGIPGSTIDAAGVAETRRDLNDVYGKTYLALEGLTLDAQGHVKPLISSVSSSLPQIGFPAAARTAAPVATAAAEPAPWFCPKCGTKVIGTAKFCPKCGTKHDRGPSGA